MFQMDWFLHYGILLIVTGSYVQANFFDCRSRDIYCANGGVCSDSQPKCLCQPKDRYLGDDCNLVVDLVASSQNSCNPVCENGGVCRSSTSGVLSCYCKSDYYGASCSKKRANTICTGDRMTIDVVPFPPFNGAVYVNKHRFDSQCQMVKTGDVHSFTFIFNGNCSVQEIPDKPNKGDTTYISNVIIQSSKYLEIKWDILFQGKCIFSGNGSNSIGGKLDGIAQKPRGSGGGGSQPTAEGVYQPLLFFLQTKAGKSIVPPVYIGTPLRLYFPLSDTRKYTKLFIVKCSAINGLTGNKNRTLTMVSNGCPNLDFKEVVLNVITDTKIPAVIVNFRAFRFANSNKLSFQCDIRVCTPTETDCDAPTSCLNSKVVRRKRDVDYVPSKGVFVHIKSIRVIDPLLEINKPLIVPGMTPAISDPGTKMSKCFESKETLVMVIVLVVAVVLLLVITICLAVRFKRTALK